MCVCGGRKSGFFPFPFTFSALEHRLHFFKLTWWELVINFEREQKHLSSAFSEDQNPSYFWDVFSAAFIGKKQGLNHALPNEAIFISSLLSLAA